MRSIFAIVVLFGTTTTHAFAVSEPVKQACRDDYFSFCSQHEVGSDALRNCMRASRKQLSKVCVTALAKSGEASKADIAKYNREKRR